MRDTDVVAQALVERIGSRREELAAHIDRVGRLRDCIAYGPGILDLAHQPDEYVGIDDMVNSAKVMALTARALLRGTA
jgi:acetylornithine deacetylase/succinyl-diaminopimelate desuccinylase-like protein